MSRVKIGRGGTVAIRKPEIEIVETIPFGKSLDQPEADREQLISDALRILRLRHKLDDPIAIQMPGQSGLLRFIKLPPIEESKIDHVVHYEARQQIPFALSDTEWRASVVEGDVESGYAIESEFMLTAVKRDQLQRTLKPFAENDMAPDLVQLQPLGLFNFLHSTYFGLRNSSKWVALLDCGASNSTLIITDGKVFWQRSIPIGGSHFTKALMKEMKLTFAKAEQLKREAIRAEDPKRVFQAMRAVFQDLCAEVQRSLAFFASLHRKVEVSEMVFIGNTFQLPGLKLYLLQNTELKELKLDPENVFGGAALKMPGVIESYPTLVAAINLCLERLNIGRHLLNLIPEEETAWEKFRQKIFRITGGRLCRERVRVPLGASLRPTTRAWGIDVGTSGLRAVRMSMPA